MNTNSEQTETIAQEAYRLLKDVDENKWIETFMSNGCGLGCALGHYNRLKSENPSDFSETNMASRFSINMYSNKLRETSNTFLSEKYTNISKDINKDYRDIANINNNKCEDYQESTPKERVLHLLTDMIEAGY